MTRTYAEGLRAALAEIDRIDGLAQGGHEFDRGQRRACKRVGDAVQRLLDEVKAG